MFSQSLTNILTPASQQLANSLSTKNTLSTPSNLIKKTSDNEIVSFPSSGSRQFKPLTFSKPEFQQSMKQLNSIFNFGRLNSNNEDDLELKTLPLNNFIQKNNINTNNNQIPAVNQPAMNSLLQLANTFFRGGNNDYDNLPSRQSISSVNSYKDNNSGSGISQLLSMNSVTGNKNNNYQMPTLRQFLPLADRNFGFQQGEGKNFLN